MLRRQKNPLITDTSTAPPEHSSRVFPVPARGMRIKEAQKKRDKAHAKKFIRAENCDWITNSLPLEEGEELHTITPGDFVFMDLLVALAERVKPKRVQISTLSMSAKNVDQLAGLVSAGIDVRLLVSQYWAATDTQNARGLLIAARIPARMMRIHTKIYTIDDQYTLYGSANLRSSVSIEQTVIVRSQPITQFYNQFLADSFNAADDLEPIA